MYFSSPILKIFCIVVTLLLTLAHAQDYDIFYKKLDQFRLNLFHRVENQNSQKNVIISPLSVQSVIGMLNIGAEGETAAEVEQTFAMNVKYRFSMYFEAVLNFFRRMPGVTIANKLYINENYDVKEEYRNELTRRFSSSIEAVDFLHAEQTAKSINEWVKEQTNDLIPQLVRADSFDDNTNLFLVNTITFSGEWKHKFNEAYTEMENFYLDGREPIKVPMMYQSGKFVIQDHDNLGAKSLILPYKTERLSFVIFLPNSNADFQRLEKNIRNIELSNLITGSWNEIDVEVKIPKFKAEFEFDSKDTLQNMGLRKLFSDSPDLSGISNAPLSVSKFIHKAVINVDEKGSTAAAASGVGIGYKFGAESFNVNRPFIYFIKDDQDMVLFSGSYKEPEN